MGKLVVGLMVGAVLAISALFVVHLNGLGPNRAALRQKISERLEIEKSQPQPQHQ